MVIAALGPSSERNAHLGQGGRQLGGKLHKHTLVTATNQLPDGRWEVITDKGRVVCEHLVNAAGCYAPQVGAMAGIDVPIVSVIARGCSKISFCMKRS